MRDIKNVTLYASWTKNSGEPEQPVKETVKRNSKVQEKQKQKLNLIKEVSKRLQIRYKT